MCFRINWPREVQQLLIISGIVTLNLRKAAGAGICKLQALTDTVAATRF